MGAIAVRAAEGDSAARSQVEEKTARAEAPACGQSRGVGVVPSGGKMFAGVPADKTLREPATARHRDVDAFVGMDCRRGKSDQHGENNAHLVNDRHHLRRSLG